MKYNILDLNILKTILTNKLLANEFASFYEATLFSENIRLFARLVIDYVRAFKIQPTVRTLSEYQTAHKSLIEECFAVLDKHEYNEVEYAFDLIKLKERYEEWELDEIRKSINEKSKSNASLSKDIALKIQNIQSLKNGRAYTQRTVREHLPRFKEKYVANALTDTSEAIKTYYSGIDYATDGILPAEMVIIGAETAGGKMLPLTTLIPTPDGFKKMADIHVGDMVFGKDGRPCTVLAESEIVKAAGYKFIFDDKTEIVSHDKHLWLTFDRKEQVQLSKRTNDFRKKERLYKRKSKSKKSYIGHSGPTKPPPKGTVRSTEEIVKTLKLGKRRNHAIPLADSLQLQKKNLLIDPYVFGLWLGDGTSSDGSITTMDRQIVSAVIKAGFPFRRKSKKVNQETGEVNKAYTYFFDGLKEKLKLLGVLNNKHIPHDYLWSHKTQRLSLLQGLMDTDGHAYKRGRSVDFYNKNKNIADGAVFLFNSLGESCTISEKMVSLNGEVFGPYYIVRATPLSNIVFRLKRKVKRQTKKNKTKKVNRNKWRFIVEAKRTAPVQMKCIQVSSPDSLYLAGKNLIPTHNSILLSNMATQMWLQDNNIYKLDNFSTGYNVLFLSLEMPYEDCFSRFLARLADVPQRSIIKGTLTDDEREKVAQAEKFIEAYPYEFEIVDVPRDLNINELELRFNDAMLKYKPHIVVVDYLSLMESKNAKEQDWLRLGYLAGQLHEFARAHNVVVLTAVQLTDINRNNKSDPKNRSEEQTVGTHRVGRSSLILHHANLFIQLEKRPGEMAYPDLKYHIVKNRKGPLLQGLLKKHFENGALYDKTFTRPNQVLSDDEDIGDKIRKIKKDDEEE